MFLLLCRIEDEFREKEELARIKERDRVLIQEARMRRAAGMSQTVVYDMKAIIRPWTISFSLDRYLS